MKSNPVKVFYLFVLLMIGTVGCDNNVLIPKPPTHLMVDLPAHSYKPFKDSTNYTFEMSKLWNVRFNFANRDSLILYLGKQIDGDLHFQYFKIDTANTLAKLINQTFAKIDYHKIKAKINSKIKNNKVKNKQTNQNNNKLKVNLYNINKKNV